MTTLAQKQAQLEKQLASVKEKRKKEDTAQKVVIGGMMLSLARKDPAVAKKLLSDIEQNVTRKTDKKRLESVIEELTKLDQQQQDTTKLW